jgi:hypothetical protein
MVRAALIASLCALLVGSAEAQDAERLTIFVGPQVRDGFVDMDAGIRDSIKDIQQECQAIGWTVVPTADVARLTIIVLGRGC